MADEKAKSFGKGERVRITAGKAEGITGTVFWKGENKWGPGDRYGVRGDDGQTHWVDSASVESTDAAVPEGPTFERGARVRFRQDGQEGTGTVFWTGTNRQGPGQRLGINPDGAEGRDDAVWVDALAARPLDPAEDPANHSGSDSSSGGQTMQGGNGGGADGGDDVAEIPPEYSTPVGMDERPPAAPFDDDAIDQMAGWADEDDQPPPADW